MRGALGIIRWKFVVPMAVVVAATAVFFVVFFDPIVERAVESAASKINGAKVELDGLKTTFASGRVDIARLQVTDREHPMQNVVETGALSFQMSPAEAIKKRFIINEAAIKGLQFNTARKTSGAIPKLERRDEAGREPGAAEKLYAKYKDRFQVNLAGMKSDLKERIEFDPKQTRIVKLSNELKEKSETLPESWETRIDTLDAENRLKKIESDLESIKDTPTKGAEALTAIPAALKKLKDSRDALQKLRDDVRDTKNSIATDIKNYRAGIASLPAAKKQDMDDLMGRLNLDFADPERLMEGMIGPLVLQRFQTIMKYVEIARKHMPSKKEKESVPQRPRASGMDVRFPTPAALPRFWLKKAALDGKYQDISAAGALANLTTDPPRIGRPFTLALDGARGAQKYELGATFDHVGEVAKDSFVVKATGIDLKSVTGQDAVSALAGGTAAADIAFSVIGEGNLGGRINLRMAGVKLDRASFFEETGVPSGDNLSTEDRMKASFATSVVQAVEAMPEISVSAQLFGTWKDPSLKLSSNLTGALAGVIKSSVGNAVKDQRAQLESRLDAVMAKEKAELDAKAQELQNKVNERIRRIEADVEKKVSEAAGISLPAGAAPNIKLPGLDKLFK